MITSHNRAILHRLGHGLEVSSLGILVYLERAGLSYHPLDRNALLTLTMPPFHDLHALTVDIQNIDPPSTASDGDIRPTRREVEFWQEDFGGYVFCGRLWCHEAELEGHAAEIKAVADDVAHRRDG